MTKKETWKQVMPKTARKTAKKNTFGMPIIKKIFSDLAREKTISFAILLQLFIILTSSLLLTNSMSIFNPDNLEKESITIGITGDMDQIPIVEEYIKDSGFAYAIYTSQDNAEKDFESEKIDGIIDILPRTEHLPIYIRLTLVKGDVRSSMLLSEMKSVLEIYENELREKNLAEPDAILLDRLRIKEVPNPVATQIFEALYSILIPFLLLMPGVLIGGLIIDILMEELEKKTLNLLILILSFRRYLFELLVATMGISVIQILLWQLLLSWQGIIIANLPAITAIVIMVNFIMFIFCILLTLTVMDKTRAQLIYSFLMLLLFASTPLFSVNPIRVISRLAIGLVQVNFIIYFLALAGIAAALFSAMMFVVESKEW